MTTADSIIHAQGKEKYTSLCGGRSGSGITITGVKAHVDCARCQALMSGNTPGRHTGASVHRNMLNEAASYLTYGGK
jgi:hypothetical protein